MSFEITVRGEPCIVSEAALRDGAVRLKVRNLGVYCVVNGRRFATRRDARDYVDDFNAELRRIQPLYTRYAACLATYHGLKTLGWGEEFQQKALAEIILLGQEAPFRIAGV